MSTDSNNQDAAAVDAMAEAVCLDHDIDWKKAKWCQKQSCRETASAILAAIRECRVPTLYHISQIPGCREFESRHEKDQKEIAALRARCETAEAKCAAAETQIALMRDEDAQRSKTEALRLLWDGNRQKDEARARTAMEALGVSAHWDCMSGKTIGAMVLELVEVAKKSLEQRDDAIAAKEKAERERDKDLAEMRRFQGEHIKLSRERDAARAEVARLRKAGRWAEGLIRQLPHGHNGRDSWLLNHGHGEDVERMRDEHPTYRTHIDAAQAECAKLRAEVERLQKAGENQCDTFQAIGVALGLKPFDWRNEDTPPEWKGYLSKLAKEKMDRIAALEGALTKVRDAIDAKCVQDGDGNMIPVKIGRIVGVTLMHEIDALLAKKEGGK